MTESPRRYPAWRYGLATLLSLGLIVGLNTLSLRVLPEAADEARFLAPGLRRLEQGDIPAVNFGGSVGKALLFSELGIAGVDFAANSRDLLENEALLEVVLTRARGLRLVFLAVDPMNMLLDNAWSEPQRRRQYYRMLATDRGWRPIGGDWSNLIQGRLLPLARHDRWSRPLAAVVASRTGPASAEQPVEPSGLEPEPSADLADSADRLRAGGGFILSMLSGIDRTRYFEYRTPERNEAALIRFCRTVTAHGLGLVLYATPVTDLYLRETSDYVQRAMPYWNNAIRQCTAMGARVLRFDTNTAYQHAYRLFADPVHLNAAGAVVFSRDLARRLGPGITTAGAIMPRSGPWEER